MLGTFAYYLASPFNFLIFLFPDSLLPTGIFAIIVLKIGTIGLSSYYFFKKNFKNTDLITLILSISYALSGFVITNHFNLMWLDSVILLPLLLNEVEKLFKSSPKQKSYLIILLFLTWFTNFYTGYMAILFTGIYFLYRLFLNSNTANKLKLFFNYLFKNILALLLAAFLLLPTIGELLAGKATYQEDIWHIGFEFSPENILAKLISGSFDFNQMSVGMPNFYFGAILLVFMLGFFVLKKIGIKEKLLSLCVLIFLILSCSFEPLILLWHMGQFPVWYPGRFTFALSLFALILCARFFENYLINPKVSWKIIGLLILAIITFVGSKLPAFTFIDSNKLFITLGFFILGIIFLIFPKYTKINLYPFLLGLIIIDLTINMVGSLSDISYQTQSNYTNFTAQVREAAKINHQTNDFTRLEKTFDRDNDDPISNNYFGISNFDSVSDKNQVQFLENLGLLTNESSSSNAFGTIISDSLLGIKYYLTENYGHELKQNLAEFDEISSRPDLNLYKKIDTYKQIKIYENPFALPTAFLVTKKPNDLLKDTQTSRLNLANTLQDFAPNNNPYLAELSLLKPELKNASIDLKNHGKYTPMNKNQISSVAYTFTPTTNNPYYLSLPSYLDEDSQIRLFIDNKEINQNDLGNGPKLINLAANQKTYPIKITFIIEKATDLSGLIIYEFNLTNFKKITTRLQNQDLKLQLQNNRILQTKKFKTTKLSYVQTLVPNNRNWHVYDAGQPIKKELWNKTLIRVKVKPGSHQIILKYIPTELYFGIIISVLTGISLLILKKFKSK